MTTIIRIEFKSDPKPETYAAILAAASFDPSYRDADALKSED